MPASIERQEKTLPNYGQLWFKLGHCQRFSYQGRLGSLNSPKFWPSIYVNSSNIKFKNKVQTFFRDYKFSFKTFGLSINAEIIEFMKTCDGRVGRLAWHDWAEGEADYCLDVVHAWLEEILSGNRNKISTQLGLSYAKGKTVYGCTKSASR